MPIIKLFLDNGVDPDELLLSVEETKFEHPMYWKEQASKLQSESVIEFLIKKGVFPTDEIKLSTDINATTVSQNFERKSEIISINVILNEFLSQIRKRTQLFIWWTFIKVVTFFCFLKQNDCTIFLWNGLIMNQDQICSDNFTQPLLRSLTLVGADLFFGRELRQQTKGSGWQTMDQLMVIWLKC